MVRGVGWVNGAGTGRGRAISFATGGNEGLPKLSSKELFRRPFPRFGRMDSYSRTGLAAIALALKDAGLDEPEGEQNIAVVASTVYGSLSADADYFSTVISDEGRLASPNFFVYALPNTYLGEAAIYFRLTGPGFVCCESSASGLHGLRRGIDGIEREEYEIVLTGVCDVGTPPSIGGTNQISLGALFFVLQGESRTLHQPYGALTQDDMGTTFFENAKVNNLNDLAAICTAKIRIKNEVMRSI
ncbi:MAG: hypothetical protein LBQ00_04270 [Syntrophobacterales bacterium]|jgi:3-oxoacyl-[acyl-carrier-protein] synthase II|nr:hypothetical protein [Syntrophobacterales bacterium]